MVPHSAVNDQITDSVICANVSVGRSRRPSPWAIFYQATARKGARQCGA